MPLKDKEKRRTYNRENMRIYRTKHLDYVEREKIWYKTWYEKNDGARIKRVWNQRNKEARKKIQSHWEKENRKSVQERRRRHRYNRRGLPKIEVFLNEKFDGSRLHHMGNGFGMYVPRRLHETNQHSLLRNEKMDEFNWKCLEWLVN